MTKKNSIPGQNNSTNPKCFTFFIYIDIDRCPGIKLVFLSYQKSYSIK